MNDLNALSQATPTVLSGATALQSARRRSAWHYLYTFALVALVVGMSFAGANQQGQIAQKHGHVLFYVLTMTTEFILLGLCYMGIRFSGMTLREVVGGRWNSASDLFGDVAIALGFWIVSYAVLIGLALAMHMANAGGIDQGKKTIQMLAPKTALELVLWICMSMVAGFVEEIVFRGYFQRQFGSLLRNIWLGMLASAAVFGLSHAYEGRQRMFLIFVYGAMFGALTIFRKSLRPGMMAHGIFDSFQGLLLFVADKLLRSGIIK